MKSFEILFDSAPVSIGHLMRCVKLFSSQIEVRTKYTDFPVTAIIEARFVYLSREDFAFMCFDFSSSRFRFHSDVVRNLLSPVLRVLWPRYEVKVVEPSYRSIGPL